MVSNKDEIMVSICCMVYNHEKYLRECLDGFIMQKTNFKFEVLIHDDASTDGSAEIIREYEKKYPDIIKPIFQTENQYSKGVKISWTYQYPRAKGKYIALCEGDDFWCDNNKLQLQFDIMERDTKLSLCVNTVRCVLENGNPTKKTMPAKMERKRFDKDEFIYLLTDINNMYSFQTSSYFFKAKDVVEIMYNLPQFIKVNMIGDMPLMQYLGTKGDVFYIDREMSCYRLNSVSGWTRRLKKSKDFAIQKRNLQIESIREFDYYTNGKYHERIDNIIAGYEFANYVEVHNYKKMREKKYVDYWNKLNTKAHIYHFICYYIPIFENIYGKFITKEG